MWSVTKYSFSEPIRNPWMLIGVLAFSGMFVALLVFAVLEGNVLSADRATDFREFLSFARGFLFPLGLILGFGLISQEVANGSIQLGMLRPIPRWRYLVGRLCGRMGLLAAIFVLMVESIEISAMIKGAVLDPGRIWLWLGLLLFSESVIVALCVLGTVCTRVGSFVLYWLYFIMFLLIDYFSSICPHEVIWHTVNTLSKIFRALLMGIPVQWVIEADLSPWHTSRLLFGWIAHFGFLTALGIWAFRFREPGLRE